MDSRRVSAPRCAYLGANSAQFDVRGFEGCPRLIEDPDLRLNGRPAGDKQIVAVNRKKAVPKKGLKPRDGCGDVVGRRCHDDHTLRRTHINLACGIEGALESLDQTVDQLLAGEPWHDGRLHPRRSGSALIPLGLPDEVQQRMLGRQVCRLHERDTPSVSFHGLYELHRRWIVGRAIRQSSGNGSREVARGQPRIDGDSGRAAQPLAGAQFAERVPGHPGNGVAQPRVSESGETPASILGQLQRIRCLLFRALGWVLVSLIPLALSTKSIAERKKSTPQ